MASNFKCPKCNESYEILELELWEVFEDGKETEFDCTNCECEFIITSQATVWNFTTEVND